MSTRHRHPQHLEWRSIAVDEPDAHAHARELQRVLTELTEQGYNLVSMLPRGSALIVTASRMNTPPAAQEEPASPTGSGKLSN